MASVTITESSKVTSTTAETKTESQQTPTLRLKPQKQAKTIQWAENTVDNEGMGKKSSKCCCIYKKPRIFGESSSEEDSDEDDECKAPKDYHKKSKRKNNQDEHGECNACP